MDIGWVLPSNEFVCTKPESEFLNKRALNCMILNRMNGSKVCLVLEHLMVKFSALLGSCVHFTST